MSDAKEQGDACSGCTMVFAPVLCHLLGPCLLSLTPHSFQTEAWSTNPQLVQHNTHHLEQTCHAAQMLENTSC